MPVTARATKSVNRTGVTRLIRPFAPSKDIFFAHVATAAQTVIVLTALTPPPAMTLKGYLPPSAVDIAAIDLVSLPYNLFLKSNIRELDLFRDYQIIAKDTIKLIVGAVVGEEFYGRMSAVVGGTALVSSGGGEDPGGGGGATFADATLKQAKNMTGGVIPANRPVSRTSLGTLVLADSDSLEGQKPFGVTTEAIPNTAFGTIRLVGPNVSGALTGLGFVPGDDIFISETGNFTRQPEAFTGNDDSIIMIGIADVGNLTEGALATDLVLTRQVIIRPG